MATLNQDEHDLTPLQVRQAIFLCRGTVQYCTPRERGLGTGIIYNFFKI